MNIVHAKHLTLAAAFASVLLLGGCLVERDDQPGGRKNVDIHTPVGDLSVVNDSKAPDTGLPVYPGARVQRKDDHSESANVNIDTSFFGVKVAAATFESDDAPGAIVDFYRNAMRTYGPVTECRGDVDFRGRPGSKEPVCREKASSRELQLVAGTEDRQRVVSVKPRGSGSEFAVVHVETRQ